MDKLIDAIIAYAKLNDFLINLPQSEHDNENVSSIQINFEKKNITFN